MTPHQTRQAFMALLASTLFLVWMPAAKPCINTIYKVNYKSVGLLTKAGRLLAQGKPRKALDVAKNLNMGGPQMGKDSYQQKPRERYIAERLRQRLIVAMAVVRLNGRYGPTGKRVPKKAQWKQLNASAKFLKPVRSKTIRTKPLEFAHYAEALERLGNNRDAYKIMLELHTADLLNTSLGVASFARLAASSGDSELSTKLFGKCSMIAGKRASKVCLRALKGLLTKPAPKVSGAKRR